MAMSKGEAQEAATRIAAHASALGTGLGAIEVGINALSRTADQIEDAGLTAYCAALRTELDGVHAYCLQLIEDVCRREIRG